MPLYRFHSAASFGMEMTDCLCDAATIVCSVPAAPPAAFNWFPLFQTVFLVTGFLTATYTVYRTQRLAKVTNLLTITAGHRDIWSKILTNDLIEPVLYESGFDPTKLTAKQRTFVNFVILHLNATFEAARAGALVKVEQIALDAGTFFSLPGPGRIWEENKKYQNARFRDFVDRAIEAHRPHSVDDDSG